MKKAVFVALTVITLAVPLAGRAATEYGKPLTVQKTTRISAILDDADAYVGKMVKVEGIIVQVCARRGCWIEIASDRQYEKIRIKVEDGVIVFPLSARGKTALVEGRVEAIFMSLEEARNFYAHQAEEKGSSFDPASITAPVTLYQIRATGAVVD